ncbi:PREDICTED: uncharacterized protein LOC107064394 [Polistes dominula]|uniref:Uncharacterized protein LOC107064394 n=1 Tax=Polistes dominula TaxID=743375 RepID=A0ABM1HX41_POLDO|nr:PREDICTED: uncharacterized protein LOC107064394 [Polistes dominula]
MCNIQMKLKTWIQLIKSGTLENIIEDIMTNNYFQSDENAIISNKDVFKLILHLAHAANNCDKQKYKDGKDIGNLAFLLCSNLSTIPDNERFISSLYHIIRCLLRMNLYKEAENLSLHLIQDNVECTENKTNEIFRQLTYLWHESAEKELINFQEKPNHREHYDRYKNAIKYELLITKKSYKNHARHVITKLCIYLRKLIAMKNISIKYINDFIKYIIDEDYEHMSIDQNDKHKIYSSILSIIAKLICTNYNNDGDDKKFLMDILKDERNYFKNMIFDDCYQSFVHFKNTCITLLQPDEELTESVSKNIEKLTNQYIDIVQRCGYTDTVTITASFFVEIFQYVFLYWENNVTLGKMQFLKSNILYETMKLIDQISKTLLKTVMENCICSNNKCTIKIDLYNHIILKALSENILQFINKFMEENIFYLKTLKESHCKHWTTLWSLCGRLLYNMGSTFESFYDTSTFFISLLCSSIIYFEGMHCEHSHLKIQNPLCVALYKLSNIHYKKCMYREAMTVSALHGLLSYTDKNSKAFKVWTSIKYKMAQTSSNFVNMSMISCLQNDRKIIEDIGIHIDLSKYDLIELCLTEAIALKNVKVNLIEAFHSLLNELHILKANIIQRTYLIQLFGYHLLHIQENYTSDIFTNTLSELELLKDKSINILCLKANLLFFIYVNELRISNECTRIEMNNAEFALKAPKLSDNQGTYVIPAYSKINIKEDLRLMELLEKSLKTWDEIEPNIIDVTQSWEPLLTLNILTIIAEYSRLYRYENCESKAWNLASKLAIELDNKDIFVYVTGRSLYLRQINKQWIDQAKEYVDNIKDYDNESKLQIIAMFWISLADFYFECGEYTTATKLLDDARSLPGITFQNNTSVYLYSLDTIIRNYNFYKKNTEQEEYTSYIIESLYSLICLKDSLTSIKWMNPNDYLCSYDILFSCTVNMSTLINSLLSFKEITAHLVIKLKSAQSLGATIRTAEILKSLCFIDLSRSRLDDCEVKLQGLEHILDTETIKLSMDTNLKPTILENLKTSPNRLINSRNNIMQNDTSPVLRRKIFNYPDFLLHNNCTCTLCQHIQYQYLLFASTHIRAQLYALQNNVAASLEHFHGAFKMKEKFCQLEQFTLPRNLLKETNNTIKFTWQARLYITDYILLLLHFSFLLKAYITSRKDEALKIALLAVEICETQKIESHPVYISAKELVYKYQFEEIITDQDYSSFTVPKTPEIDISKFIVQDKVSYKMCVTPVTHNQPKNPISIRRNKTPPLSKLKKVNINLSDDESDDSSSPSKLDDLCKTPISRPKLVRRKILENEYVDDNTTDKSNEKMDVNKMKDISVTKIITKVAPLVPNISDHLNKITKKFDIPATNETVEKLFEMVDNLEISSPKSQRRLRSKSAPNSKESSCDNEVKDSIELFKKLVISEVETNNIVNVKQTVPTIVIDNTEATGISHKSRKTKNTLTNGNNSLEIVTLNTESEICKISKSQRRVTRSTRSTKSSTVTKTTSSVKKASSFR